jgi:hypothetical protein
MKYSPLCLGSVHTSSVHTSDHVQQQIHLLQATDTFAGRESVPIVGIGPKRSNLEANANKKQG